MSGSDRLWDKFLFILLAGRDSCEYICTSPPSKHSETVGLYKSCIQSLHIGDKKRKLTTYYATILLPAFDELLYDLNPLCSLPQT